MTALRDIWQRIIGSRKKREEDEAQRRVDEDGGGPTYAALTYGPNGEWADRWS